MQLLFTGRLATGGVVTFDLAEIKNIDPGKYLINPPGPLPTTTVYMIDNTVYVLDCFEYARLLSAFKALGLMP